jgi:PAS domain S-box-containing protein
MNWISTRMRITVGLACLVLSVLLLSMLTGVLPDREKAVLEGRRSLCEAISVNSSIMVSQQDLARLQAVLRVTTERNPDILSAALRRNDGELLVEVGDHRRKWKPLDDEHSIDTQVQVPIHAGDKHWGNVEICFRPVAQKGLMGFFFGPRLRLLWFVCGSCFVFFFFYMTKMLEYLDPSQAVPGHVRSALDTLAEGLLVIDGRDRIVLANGAFAAMLGKSPDKLLGHVASRLPWVHEKENEPSAALPWTVALREETAKSNTMLRLRTVGGDLRTFIVNSSPVLGSKGQYRGVLVSFDDVTDLEEKECELRKAVASADAANRTKSEFLANMSHEIRTPMNAILGFTDVLRRGFAADEQTRQRYLDTIHFSGKHLLELINDILDLSKIEAGRLDVERTACSPCELIAELVAMFTVPSQDRGISLEFTTSGPVPATILTDPTRFRQIIANLVGNAIKFTEAGGVKIVARLLPNGERPQLAIDVIDTGIGISPEGLGKIFDPFVQADSAITRRFGGTGLGLTISRRFAAALGGELTVASELGKGSTFTVTLDTGPLDGIRLLDAPQAKTSPALSDGRFAKNLPTLPPAHVLVVDDGEANRQLITVILTRAGVKVESAENGEVAVRMATSRHFDLILMDMQMPVMDGYTATTKLRQQGLSIPIVALTASVMKGAENRCGAVGCSAYVAKPVDIDELMRCLAEQLKGIAASRHAPAQEIASHASQEIPAPRKPADENRIPAASCSPKAQGESKADPTEFVGFVKEQINAMHSALQRRQFAALAQLAGSVKQTAYASGHGEFHAAAMRLEDVAERQTIDDIEDVICELAILSESIALRSLRPAERPLEFDLTQGDQSDLSIPGRLPASRTVSRRRPPLVCSLPMDDSDFRQIVEGFIQRLRDQAVAMQAAWERRDLDELASLSHWLKGAGGTVGFDAFTDPAKKLELLAKQKQVDEIGKALGEVLDMIDSAAIPLAEPAVCHASA